MENRINRSAAAPSCFTETNPQSHPLQATAAQQRADTHPSSAARLKADMAAKITELHSWFARHPLS